MVKIQHTPDLLTVQYRHQTTPVLLVFTSLLFGWALSTMLRNNGGFASAPWYMQASAVATALLMGFLLYASLRYELFFRFHRETREIELRYRYFSHKADRYEALPPDATIVLESNDDNYQARLRFHVDERRIEIPLSNSYVGKDAAETLLAEWRIYFGLTT